MEELESRYRIEVPDPQKPKDVATSSAVPDPAPIDPGNVQPGQRQKDSPEGTTFEEHDHNGLNGGKPVSIRNLKDFFEVLSATPTHKAKNAWDQIKIVNNAGTRELWVYDYLTADWHKI